MSNLKTLSRQAKQLASYVKKTMPKEVGETWLWTAQNAFLTETDPQTGRKWEDRYGAVYSKDGRDFRNLDAYGDVTYSKLHRTGRLLRGLKVKRSGEAITLFNTTPYASEHETGRGRPDGTIKGQYVRAGVAKIDFVGTKIHRRSSMSPSEQVLKAPYRLVGARMRKFGW